MQAGQPETASTAGTSLPTLPALQGLVISALDPLDRQLSEIDPYYYEDYQLTAVLPGTSFWVGLEATFDAYLEIIDAATQQVVAWDHDSGRGTDALLGFRPLEGISYLVRASSFVPASTGAFTLKTLEEQDAKMEWLAGAVEQSSGSGTVVGSSSYVTVTAWNGTVTFLNPEALLQPYPEAYGVIEALGNVTLLRHEDGRAFVGVGTDLQPVTSPWGTGAGGDSSEWQMLAAETLGRVNTILWRYNSAHALHFWILDANWSWQASEGMIPLGTDEAWDLEIRFQVDVDRDGVLGIAYNTIESQGSTTLLRRGDGQVFVEVGGARQRLASPWNSAPGDPSTAWQMLAAETIGGVNTMLWRYNAGNALHLWTLDANWSWQASEGLIPLGTAEAWDLETSFQVDADRDGTIGATYAVLEAHGNITLLSRGDGQAFLEVGGVRQRVSSPWNSGTGSSYSDWQMLAAETVEGVNTILWRYNSARALHFWTLDANWGWTASEGLIPLGSEEAWQIETRFQVDTDGDGRIGVPLPVVNLSINRAVVAEDGADTLVYTFTRGGPLTEALSVSYAVTGTASLASDYSGIAPGGATQTIPFAAGSATATLTLDPVADATIEANETIALSLVPDSGYIIGTSTAVTGAILNDDTSLTLYDASTATLPSQQGWLAFGTGLVGSQSLSPNGTTLNTTAFGPDLAGYSNYAASAPVVVNSGFPDLDRGAGFSLDVRLRLLSETHATSTRAGFSLTLLDQGPAPLGIELGFWSDSIFSQAGGATPFTAVAERVDGLDTTVATTYSLRIVDQSYTLLANNRLILSGPLQDYSQATLSPRFPYNPYTTPNFLFLGDNTGSASAQVELGSITLAVPSTGSDGADTLTGTAGSDHLHGLDGDDWIATGAGDDWLIGGPGADVLLAGSGNDLLTGGAGGDWLAGGSGDDIFVYATLADSLLASYDVLEDYNVGDVLDRPGAGAILTQSIGSIAGWEGSPGSLPFLTPGQLTDLLTAETFLANSGAAFTVDGFSGTFLALNDGSAGFDAFSDAVVLLQGYTIGADRAVTFV